ncbi:cation:proton antiporter [Mesorhizobium microcysteis]|uniref:Cation:proton antiporter n=1 Tax=Neoaquamicrobium microcysteis TaxID=2682781 RepID=A0A5D4GVC6_9HYPH|nr:cation:proton antiporter [Mesorhizobium microcysteis]
MVQALYHGGVFVALMLLLAALVCAGVRIVRGPSGPDRVVALDILSLLGVAAAGMAVIVSGSTAFIDIALGVALVGFLASVAFAGFIERGSIDEEEEG